MRFDRIMLKLSGEALEGGSARSIDPGVLSRIAREISAVRGKGVQVGVVLGGGNLFRGMTVASQGMDRTAADTMGMLATIMNCVALQARASQRGPASVYSISDPREPSCRSVHPESSDGRPGERGSRRLWRGNG